MQHRQILFLREVISYWSCTLYQPGIICPEKSVPTRYSSVIQSFTSSPCLHSHDIHWSLTSVCLFSFFYHRYDIEELSSMVMHKIHTQWSASKLHCSLVRGKFHGFNKWLFSITTALRSWPLTIITAHHVARYELFQLLKTSNTYIIISPMYLFTLSGASITNVPSPYIPVSEHALQ